MTPKSGKPGSRVAPAAPTQAEEADKADPGAVAEAKAEQSQSQSGKYGSEKAEPFKEPKTEEEKQARPGWIEIEMVDESDKPVPGVAYEVTLPDGSVASGTLDEKGFARVEGFEPGQCEVTFPDLDAAAWEKI